MRRAVADLERDAFKRDRSFVLRLEVVLIVGTLGGAFMFAGLTGTRVASCAAQAFGGVSESPPPGAPVPEGRGARL